MNSEPSQILPKGWRLIREDELDKLLLNLTIVNATPLNNVELPAPEVSRRMRNIIAGNTRLLDDLMDIKKNELETAIEVYKDPDNLIAAVEKIVNKGIVLNPSTKQDITDIESNLKEAYKIGAQRVSSEVTPTDKVISKTVKESMGFVTKLDKDMKKELGKILSDGLKEGKFHSEIVQEMADKVQITKARAQAIARTESMRANNMAGWTTAKATGHTHFTVDFSPSACEDCIDNYSGAVFEIDDVDNLPPYHTNCECVAVYFTAEDEAQGVADRIEEETTAKREELLQDGYGIPSDGTGPIHPDLMAESN